MGYDGLGVACDDELVEQLKRMKTPQQRQQSQSSAAASRSSGCVGGVRCAWDDDSSEFFIGSVPEKWRLTRLTAGVRRP